MKKITFSLSPKSIAKAIKEIEDYKVYLKQKTIELRQALAQVGLETADANVGVFNGIVFEVRDDGNRTLLVGWSDRQLRTWWNKQEGQVVNNDYSPILMAEFGSGVYADAKHRGTFPTGKGNGKKNVWAYREYQNSELTFSDGERPTRPMLKASEEMATQIVEVARKVFSNV